MEILGTTKISYEIERILEDSEKFLILVSPYLKFNHRLKVRLSDAFKRTEKTFILFRENELKKEDFNWLKSFKNLELIPLKNLHAKIYANEEDCLVSSMNLYEYSQINNHEIGILIDRYEDDYEYKETFNEIRIMIESSGISTGFNEVIGDYLEDYSMGKLFWILNDKFSFRNFSKGSQPLYEYLCDKSRELVRFEDEELYRDKTAILRASELGKKRYLYLEKELGKLAN